MAFYTDYMSSIVKGFSATGKFYYQDKIQKGCAGILDNNRKFKKDFLSWLYFAKEKKSMSSFYLGKKPNLMFCFAYSFCNYQVQIN